MEQIETNRLKKCPFCGNKDIVIHAFGWENTDRFAISIECENCGAGIANDKYKSNDAIIKIWNNRI